MKKVILNAVVLGLNGETVTVATGRTLRGENGVPTQETKAVKFAEVALGVIIRSTTNTDEETNAKFDLAKKLNDNLKLETPTEIELTDAEFADVNAALSRQTLIVKARFLEMVEAQNPA